MRSNIIVSSCVRLRYGTFSSGIGFTTVLHLARKGCKVYLAARNEQKATEALKQLKADGLGPGHGEVIWLKLDLADLKGAQVAAQEILEKELRLDILGQSCLYTQQSDNKPDVPEVNNAAM